jgi:hypothetical protein
VHATLTCLWPRVLDRTTEPNVVADEVGSTGIGLEIVDVDLLHFELAGEIPAVVGLAAF